MYNNLFAILKKNKKFNKIKQDFEIICSNIKIVGDEPTITEIERTCIRMQITDVKVRKVDSENRMKAVASVTFDDAFAVHDIKVIESATETFIAMPSRKTPKGDWKDIAHPINSETRSMIQKAILDEYERILKEPAEGSVEE